MTGRVSGPYPMSSSVMEGVKIFDYCDHSVFQVKLNKKNARCINYHIPNTYLFINMSQQHNFTIFSYLQCKKLAHMLTNIHNGPIWSIK